MEKCLFGKIEIKLPELLVEDEDIFLDVIHPSSWQDFVSDADKQHLMTLLPSFPDNDPEEKQDSLYRLYDRENFKFGNPLLSFHKQLREGQFSPDIAKYAAMIKKMKRRDYEKRMKLYYSTLLKDILVNRQRLIDLVQSVPPGMPVKVSWWTSSGKKQASIEKSIQIRACKRYRQAIQGINDDCDQAGTSSDEEQEYSRNPALAGSLLVGEEFIPSVFPTTEGRPALANGTTVARPKKKSVGALNMSEAEYKAMLKRHKRRRDEEDSDDPDLDTSGIHLDDVISRTYGAKHAKLGKEKATKKKEGKKYKKMKMSGSMPALWSHDSEMLYDDAGLDNAELRDDGEQDNNFLNQFMANSQQDYGEHSNFLCLLRDFIVQETEQRITTLKLEQKVSDWSRSESGKANHWFPDHNNWTKLVSSLLNFLSGDTLGEPLENFVPFVDYKERSQVWKWIGQGRDHDDALQVLYSHWLKHKGHIEDSEIDGTATPPPRTYTDYVVKSPTEEDLDVYREQETMRFEKPQQAFTYYMHGFESVVCPVKGIYDRPDNTVKARDHVLLVPDRPSYVTILTLVRDAAARLPNGEGTRNDICELLKYSQYIKYGMSDSQLNNVVSGALDRLHYEKDPCCKYDTNRKMWVYLHRNRSEHEFDKIHATQGAVAKAKKSLIKPKPPKAVLGKKTKEQLLSTQQSPAIQVGSLAFGNLGGMNDLGGLGSIDSMGNLSGGVSLINTSLLQSHEAQQALAGARTPPRSAPTTPQISGTSPRQLALMRTSTPNQQVVSGLDLLSSVAHAKLGPGEVDGAMATIASQSQQHNVMTRVITRPIQGQAKKVNVTLGKHHPQIQYSINQGTRTPESPSILASQLLGGTTQIPIGAKLISNQAGGFSLLQQQGLQDVSQPQQIIKQIATGIPGQTKTVVLSTSKPGTPGAQQFVATLKQAGDKTMTTMLSPTGQEIKSIIPQSPVLSPPGTPGSGNNPVLARMISGSGGEQVITLSGGKRIVTTSMKLAQQGSALCYSGSAMTKTAKPLILQRAQTAAEAAKTSAQVTRFVQQNNPGATVVISRPGGVAGSAMGGGQATMVSMPTSVIASTVGSMAPQQILQQGGGIQATIGGKSVIIGSQQMHIGGKPFQLGGKPIQLGGKPLQIGGKPIQIGGKPIQIGGKPIQIGGKPIQIGGKPIQIGAPVKIGGKPGTIQITGGKPVHIGGKPMAIGGGAQTVQIGGKPVQLITNPMGGVTRSMAGMLGQMQPATISTISATQAGAKAPVTHTVSSALMNQLLQAGAIKSATTSGGMAPGLAQVRFQGQAQGMGSSAGVTQVKVVQGQPGGKAGAMAGHVMRVSQAGAMGQQILLQSSQGGATHPTRMMSTPAGAKMMAGGAKILTAGGHQQVISAGGKPHIIQTSAGKPGQNIQLVRTVVSQGAGKPAQTILLAQPAGQSAASNPQIQTIVSGGQAMRVTGGQVRGQLQTIVSGGSQGHQMIRGQAPGQMLARLVSPQGVRYATVRSQGQQQIVQGQVRQGQIIQGQVRQGQGQMIQGQVVQTTTGAGGHVRQGQGQMIQGQVVQTTTGVGGQVRQGQGQMIQGQVVQTTTGVGGQVRQGQGQMIQGQIVQTTTGAGGHVRQGQGQMIQGQVVQTTTGAGGHVTIIQTPKSSGS